MWNALIWVAASWGGCGVVLVALMIVYPRVTSTPEVFSFYDPFEAVAAPILILVTAPFWVGVIFWFAALKLWNGEVPFSESRRVWWDRYFDRESEVHAEVFDRGSALASLVAIRAPESMNWPMFRHWESPEAVVLEISEAFWKLKEDGVANGVALARIEEERSDLGSLLETTGLGLAEFVRLRMKIERQDHSLITDAQLDKQLIAAKKTYRIYEGNCSIHNCQALQSARVT